VKRTLIFFPALGFCALLAGCPASAPTQTASSNGNGASGNVSASLNNASASNAGGPLTVISPHSTDIQVEFGDLWKKSHPDIPIKWVGQGGSSDDLRFVKQQFQARGKDKGIGVDVFFGGGGETFAELEKDGDLVPLSSDYGVPQELNKVPLRAKDNSWIAAALSGFGILYNKKIATRDALPIPKTWADLANGKLQEKVELADPRKSGSAHVVYEIILQSNGWQKGWKILTGMAGNARRFTPGSSEVIPDIKSGDAVFCTAIDFYAYKAIGESGAEKLAYIQPQGQNLITPDPIGVLKGSQNTQNAEKFVQFVLSPEAQKLWIGKKGTSGGPVHNDLLRLPALPSAYGSKDAFTTLDPFNEKVSVTFDSDKAFRRRRALDDLIGAALVDNLDLVKAKWKKNPNLDATGYVPLPEKDFEALAAKWDDQTTSSNAKQKWALDARKHFSG